MPKKNITLLEAIIPIIFLIIFLAINYRVFGDEASSGANQFGLILGSAVAIIIAGIHKVPFSDVMEKVSQNIKDTVPAILILLLVGALAGTWLLSGIVPAMIYYGLQILNPTIFLVSAVIISALVATATGSSWTTSATIGIALVGIGNSLGIDTAMTAGAVISGGYFGDKMSPMSDTTNLAPAMAGTDLITHIRYMTITTFPSIIITLIIFLIIGFTTDTHGTVNPDDILVAITNRFTITPWLFVVPGIVILLIIKKAPPLVALLAGALLGVVCAALFQQDLVLELSNKINNTDSTTLSLKDIYHVGMQSIGGDINIITGNAILDDKALFSSSGMTGMLSTIELIICAMIFGGSMQSIGALRKISRALLSLVRGTSSLVGATITSCFGMNILASDQYLAIVIPGKMFSEAYEEKGLAPENLSRTLEDGGTVTSVLIPWNTCGAYQSKVLTVDVFDYLPYAFFNIISPFMSLTVAALGYKIKKIDNKTDE
ncbi:transporter (NhaC family) [Balneicella halophila]|uniref:Transporter (NhaC family) n=1 Tax=Balneicella halophila TaxID=1537566 RepID=A0A7L4UP16_BALHA|nr:Na+/H+ antiporter NhaC [Balneicella halophila]PVX50920.1 transporter (NhaC family) [Balneicella halophila]